MFHSFTVRPEFLTFWDQLSRYGVRVDVLGSRALGKTLIKPWVRRRWTHTALELPMPGTLVAMVRIACATGTVGFAIGLCGVLATNKQLWQVFCMVSVLPYNAMSCFMCGRHLWNVLPRIAELVPENDAETTKFLERSRATAKRMLAAHLIMLSAFPALIHQKVAIGQNPLIAHLPAAWPLWR